MCSGHGSFSNNPKLNGVLGHLLHSSILVPYHGWSVAKEFRTHSELNSRPASINCLITNLASSSMKTAGELATELTTRTMDTSRTTNHGIR